MGVVIRAARRPRISAADTGLFALIVLVGVGIPLAIRLSVGVVPTNDEWSFAKAALAMHAHHGVALQGFNQMFLLGQLIAAQPFLAAFGAHVAGLAAFAAISAVLWLGTTFALVRPMVGARRALMLVGVICVFPGFGLLSSSFMTDLPSTAVASVALLVCVRAFESASTWRLVVAFVLGVVAFTFREQAVAVFAIVLVGAVVHRSIRRSFRATAIVGSIACVIGCAVLEQLRHEVPHGDLPTFGLGSIRPLGVIDYSVRGAFTIALGLSPLAVRLIVRRGLGRPGGATIVTSGVVAIAAGVLLAVQPHSVLLGNYLEQQGAYPTAVVGRPAPTFAMIFWILVQVLAVFAAAVMCGELRARVARWRHRHDRPTTDIRRFLVYAYGAFSIAVYVVLALIGQRQYDRYLLPVLPVIGLLLLSGQRDANGPHRTTAGRLRIRLAPAVTVVFLLAVSIALTLSAYVRDRTIWRSAARLTAHGVPATVINAGSDWNGMHASSPLVRSGVTDSNQQYLGDMWAQFFPGSGDCYAVTLSPMDASSWRLVHVESATPYGTDFDAVPVYTYRRIDHHPFGDVSC